VQVVTHHLHRTIRLQNPGPQALTVSVQSTLPGTEVVGIGVVGQAEEPTFIEAEVAQ